jgi:hypothetical protein
MHTPRLPLVVLISFAVIAGSTKAGAGELSGAAAIADALLWGKEMPASALTSDLPRNVQSQLAQYLEREHAFHSALTPPPGATAEERESYDRRVGIERVVFCLFPRRDSARVAALYALDVDVSLTWEGASELPRREAAFIDQLLSDLPQPWLAPYLNLIAAHRRLCASELEAGAPESERGAWMRDAQRQLALAQVRGNPLIQFVAEFVATTARPCSPSL